MCVFEAEPPFYRARAERLTANEWIAYVKKVRDVTTTLSDWRPVDVDQWLYAYDKFKGAR